jgi:hypothetical protein
MSLVCDQGWRHRKDLAEGKVRDVWYLKDYGIAVRTRLGWFAGNGHRRLLKDLGEDPELIAPRVGPCASHVEAIERYVEALRSDDWGKR